MSKNRDIIEEIESKKIRSGYSSKYGYSSRIDQIDTFVEKLEKSISEEDGELLRYLPLAIVATAETFFRYSYQEIIDKGEPYFSNAVHYMKEQGNVKFDIEYLIALQGKKVSVGEIFSHLFKVNNLNDVNTTLSRILGIKFLDSLKKINYSDSIVLRINSRKFKLHFSKYIESVQRIFEYRHILAHEYAFNLSLNRTQLIQDYKNFRFFLSASDYFIEKKIGTYAPEYQQGMNRYARNKYKKSQAELNKLMKQVRRIISVSETILVGNKRLFNKSFKDWERFRENYSNSFAELFKGGTMAPLIYWSCMDRQTKYFIDNLRDEYSIELKKLF